MNNQNQSKRASFLNKRISTPKGIAIIFLALLICGGILAWQYWQCQQELKIERVGVKTLEKTEEPKEESKVSEIKSPKETEEAVIKEDVFKELGLNLKTTKLATTSNKVFGWDSVFSSNGRKVVYKAEEEDKYYVVINGEREKIRYDHIVWNPVFSPDSKHLAYTAVKNGKGFVVIDGKEGKIHNGTEYMPVFSPDSKYLAYVANEGGKIDQWGRCQGGKWFVAIIDIHNFNEEEKPAYDWIDKITFSPDSKHIAYVAGVKGQGRKVILDDKEGKLYKEIYHPLTFSPDSQHIAYSVKENMIIFDGQESKKYSNVGSPIFSSDSKNLVYVATSDHEQFIVVNGKEGERYTSVSYPTFSSDGKHLAYVVKKEQKIFVVIDSKEYGPYNYSNIRYPALSSNGGHLSFIACKGGEWYHGVLWEAECFVVLDNKKWEISHDRREYKIELRFFGSNDKHLIYLTEEAGAEFIVVNDKKGKIYDEIYTKPIFSDNGDYICYGAEIDNELWWIVDKVEDYIK